MEVGAETTNHNRHPQSGYPTQPMWARGTTWLQNKINMPHMVTFFNWTKPTFGDMWLGVAPRTDITTKNV